MGAPVRKQYISRPARYTHDKLTLHVIDSVNNRQTVGKVINYSITGICVSFEQAITEYGGQIVAILMHGEEKVADGMWTTRWRRLDYGKYTMGMMFEDHHIDQVLIKRLDKKEKGGKL